MTTVSFPAQPARTRHTRSLVTSGVGVAAILLVPLVVREAWMLNIAFFAAMYACLSTSWNITAGYLAYYSMATVGFFGLGAYGLQRVTEWTGIEHTAAVFGVMPAVALVVAMVCAPIAAVMYRTRGATFIMVTLTLVLMFEYLASNLTSITGGSRGASLPLPGLSIDAYPVVFYFVMAGVVIVGVAICWYLRNSALGLSMFAIRDDEDKARGIGVLTPWPKYLAFALAAFIAAWAGGVWAYRISYIYPSSAFDIGPLLLGTILMCLLGGLGTTWGPVLGALILTPLEQNLVYELGTARLYLVTYVVVFVGVIMLLPRGIIPTVNDRIDRHRRSRRRTGPDASALGAPDASRPTKEPLGANL
jgi:branched-chain amino acid transport system permease protein